MVYPDELLAAALNGLAGGRLRHYDLAVLMGLLANVNWRSGRINITQRALAKQLSTDEAGICRSIKRLRVELLLARAVDKASGHSYFLINPRLASVGSPQRRGHLFQQFDEAVEIPKKPE